MAVRTSPDGPQTPAPGASGQEPLWREEAGPTGRQAPFPAPAVLIPLQPAGRRWGYTAATVLPFLQGGRADHA